MPRYILPAPPPELLEFGGAEDPEKEAQLQARLHKEQRRWSAAARKRAQRIVEHSEELLDGLSSSQFEIEYVEPENGRKTAVELLDAARRRRCSTIVVGHKSHSWFRELVGHDLVEDLLRGGRGFAFWIVE